MSLKYPGGFIVATPPTVSGGAASGIWTITEQSELQKVGAWPTVPNPPTSVSAVPDNGQAAVSFTAPTYGGTSAVTSYIVTSSPGGITASGATSPVTITGLTNGTSYTFTVQAVNAVGYSVPSSASSAVTPQYLQAVYLTAGTYTWVCPSGVTSASALAIGGGGGAGRNHGSGGGGGALSYVNAYSVSAGSSYTVVVGAAGVSPSNCCTSSGTSGGTSTVFGMSAGGGGGGAYGGGSTGSGGTASGGTANYSGGSGGNGTLAGGRGPGGGGGVGGYTGAGGRGANDTGTYPSYGVAGSGSSPGTGGAGGDDTSQYTSGYNGQGWASVYGSTVGYLGGNTATTGLGSGAGGGGAGGQNGRAPGGGAVRIVWPGATRQFPNTNVSTPQG